MWRKINLHSSGRRRDFVWRFQFWSLMAKSMSFWNCFLYFYIVHHHWLSNEKEMYKKIDFYEKFIFSFFQDIPVPECGVCLIWNKKVSKLFFCHRCRIKFDYFLNSQTEAFETKSWCFLVFNPKVSNSSWGTRPEPFSQL